MHKDSRAEHTCGAAVTSVGSVSLYSSVSPVVSMAVSSTSSSLPLHDNTCVHVSHWLRATQGTMCCVFKAGMPLLRGLLSQIYC
jgi:hypothetical protein